MNLSAFSRRFALTIVFPPVLVLAAPVLAAAAVCLQQKPLPQGCVESGGLLGCTPVVQLNGTSHVDVSPDDGTLYLSTFAGAGTMVVVDRDTSTGELTQLAGTAGCISDDGTGGACTDVRNLPGASGIAFSADGAHAYVGSSSGLGIYDRNTSTGALTQKAGTAGCINTSGAEGCAVGSTVPGAHSPALSPDGRNVYATLNVDGVAVFDRNPMTGVLTQKAGVAGCISETGNAGACTDGVALALATDTIVSPDGNNVYVVSASSNAVAVFDRDPMTGVLTQKAGTAGCISEDGSGGACADGTALLLPSAGAMSPDGRNLYVVAGLTSSSLSVTVFDRDPMTGALTQKAGTAGCLSNTGTGGLCTDVRGLQSPRGIAASSDGEAVYVSMEDSDGVAVFSRNVTNGELTQVPGAEGCINRTGNDGCGVGVGMRDSLGMTASADGRSVYVGGFGDDAVAVFDRVPCPPPPTTTTTTSTTSTTTTTLPTGACAPAARVDCRERSGRARLTMRDSGDPAGSSLEFIWKRGEMTDADAFGDPVGGSTVTSLCVYAAGAPVVEIVVPPAGTCGSRPCWRAAGQQRRVYFDRTQAADGMREIVLKPGIDGRAKIRAAARGASLSLPAFPLTAPLRVQFLGDTGGSVECWDASFDTLKLNSERKVEGVR